MKRLRFEHRGRASFGQLDGESVVVFEGDMFGDKKPTGEIVPLSGIKWLTPSAPSKLIGSWNNFRAVAEKNGWAVPAEPLYFIKAANSYRAHCETILAPIAYDGRVVYEGELAVVIGKNATAVSPEKAPAHILGYTCANDVTAADLLNRDPSFPQWTRAKAFDTFGVFGPVIETDFNPAEGSLVTLVNGRERQRYPFADMIFPPAQLVSLISHDLTLYPGDVIMCGTSLGVLPLRPGQRVEVTIAGIGTLANEYQGASDRRSSCATCAGTSNILVSLFGQMPIRICIVGAGAIGGMVAARIAGRKSRFRAKILSSRYARAAINFPGTKNRNNRGFPHQTPW